MELEDVLSPHRNKFLNHNFLVYINTNKIGFSKVQNIQESCQIEEIAVGGQNFYPHIAVSPSNKAGRLILEKGLVWDDTTFMNKWKVGYYINEPINIVAIRRDGARLDRWTMIEKTFSISGGIIEKFELSDFDALDSKIVIERFEIVHNGILRF